MKIRQFRKKHKFGYVKGLSFSTKNTKNNQDTDEQELSQCINIQKALNISRNQ